MSFKSRIGTAALSRACRSVFQTSQTAKPWRFAIEQLEGRQLLSGTAPALEASATVLPFNASLPGDPYGGPSRVESVTITNNGSGFLLFDSGAFSIVGNPKATTSTPKAFAIVNAGSLPTQLAPGASTTVQLQYTPTIVGLQEAILDINSNDPTTPTFAINLNGIGTAGEFGTAEPSLVQVLRAYDIPTIVGAGPNDANINTQKYPINPDPSSQEVAMQRLVVANASQPVTITPIASFSSATPAISRIGYYTPGNPNAKTELFYIAKADAQTIDPTAVGATSFDPGTSAFSLYGTFPGTTTTDGSLDTHYSEDELNTLDPTHSRKIRFFPLKTANGTVVPNSFVFAMEDYNDPTAYNSFINFDGIISNVKAAPNAAAGSTPSSPTGSNPQVMGIQENDLAPGSDTLVFNTIKTPNSIVADVVHNMNTVTINNTGDQQLNITSLTLSDTKNWQLVNPPSIVKADSSATVTIKFIATTDPTHTTNETNDTKSGTLVSVQAAGGVWTGTLTITSNDTVNPTATVKLAGYWQIQSEHENEPSISTMTNLMFGYTSNVAGAASTDGTQYVNNGNTVINYGAEVDPSTDQGLFVAADPSQPVSILEAAAYHQQYITVSATVGMVGEAVESESEDDNNVVTITTDVANAFVVGDSVTIAGDISGYNGTFTITAVPTANTFTYTDTVGNLDPTTTAATTPKTGWYVPGSKTKFLYEDQPNNGQSMFPNLNPVPGSTYTKVTQSFTPTGAFGFNFDGEKSQDSANTDNLPFSTSEHGVRFFPVIDANGNTVANTYLACLDYRAYATPNSDYQDLYEIVSNVSFEGLPATPVDLQSSEGTSGVNLQWAPISGATGYNVYQIINGTKVLLTSSPITASRYVDTTAPSGTSIQYQVTAVNAAKKESPAAVASISVATPIPAAPTIQSADGSSGTVALSWSSVSGATSYIVSREGPGETSFTQIATGLTATTYTDSAVTAGDSYNYIVQAQNSAGPSPDSAPATVNIPGPVQTLGAPTNLLADGSSGTQVALSWSSVTSATSYNVEREASGESSFTVIATGLTDTTYNDTAVSPGSTYQYEVSAENSTSTSPLSAPASATVAKQIPTLTAPTNLAADISSGTSIALTWNASVGASTYNVERESPGSSSFVQVATGLTTNSYTDSTVVPGDPYEYAVQAASGSNLSAFSSPPVSAMLPSKSGDVLVTVGKGTNKTIQFTDVNGTLTVIKMTGVGVATVDFTGNSLASSTIKSGAVISGTDISIADITTTGTTTASGLVVTTKGGNGTVSLGAVSTDASIKGITAKTATLVGGLSVAGSISKIWLGSANAASINVTGALGTLQVTSATGVNLASAGPIKTITAGIWNSSDTITAPTIGAINISSDATLNVSTASLHSLHVRGTLSSSTLTLTGGGTIDLAMLNAGAILNSTINATGDLGTISAGSLNGSLIYAGVGSTTALPSSAADFSASDFINSVNLKKKAGVDSDVNSSIAASLVKHASLGYVQFANGGTPFGIVAETANSVTFADPSVGKSYTFTKLTAESVVTGDVLAKGITTQDFVIDIV